MPVYDSKMVGFEYPVAVGLAIPVTWTQYTSSHIKDGRIEFSVQSSCPSQDEGTIYSSGSIPGNLYQKSICSECLGHKVEYVDQGEKLPESAGEGMHSLQERKFLVCCCVKRKVNDYVPLPGMPRHSWTDEEAQTFLLGLYIFGKNLVQVVKFVGSKTMGEVLSYYYGDFFHSDAYRRWATCRKARSRRCILGLRIFSGSRQQELLSRLFGGVAREVEDPLQEIFRKFNEGTYTFEQFILTLKSTVGAQVLIEAVGIGKGKYDLTGFALPSAPLNKKGEMQVAPTGAPERSSGPAIRTTRSSLRGCGKPSSGQGPAGRIAPGRTGRGRGAAKKVLAKLQKSAPAPRVSPPAPKRKKTTAGPLKKKRKAVAVPTATASVAGASAVPADPLLVDLSAAFVADLPQDEPSADVPTAASPGADALVPPSSIASEAASVINPVQNEPSAAAPPEPTPMADAPSTLVLTTDQTEEPSEKKNRKKLKLTLKLLPPIEISTALAPKSGLASKDKIDQGHFVRSSSPSVPPLTEELPGHPGPPEWLSSASAWYTNVSAYMDHLIEEIKKVRSDLNKSKEQVELLLKDHEKVYKLEAENVKLAKANEEKQKTIEELERAKGSLEEREATLLMKINSVKTTLFEKVCESGSTMLGIVKSYFPAIEGSLLAKGFNCKSVEEAEGLKEAMKPTCISLVKEMGLDSLSSDEE